ncbi:MAG: IPT/TIG domain-containing protein [Phycisphaerales bacterium]|nr:MAG: IPT/TIG domain-containing protein [Phycisphaerales bacterium]
MQPEAPKIRIRPTQLWAVSLVLFLFVGCSPTIHNLEPSAGTPGDTITITGGRLTVGGKNPSSVDFNGTAATFKAVGNAVEAQVPNGATTGPVHVKTSYVDKYSPGGTAASPFDFTVVQSTFIEKEKNDTLTTANDASLAQIIKGSTTDTDPADWFKINSGSSGPWGYGIEIVAEPKNLPQGVMLRVDMEGYRADLGAIGNLSTYHDDKAFTLWTTHAPNTDIFLNVYWTGSTSSSFKADYTLKIARISISDTNEDDNTIVTAKEIKMSGGFGAHKTSYLCNIFKSGDDVGMQDFYYFNAGGATQISIAVVTAPLDQSDGVHVDLYDDGQGYRGGDAGNYVAAKFDYKLPQGQIAIGTWYIEVTNAWDHYASAGAGPNDKMPLSCKAPYTIMVAAN